MYNYRFGFFLMTPLVTHLSYHTPSNLGQKRRRNSKKENELLELFHLPTHTPLESMMNSKKRKPYTPRKTPTEKLEAVFSAIEEAKWGLGDFLYHVFRLQDEDGEHIQRSKRHAGMVQRFCREMLDTHLLRLLMLGSEILMDVSQGKCTSSTPSL